MDRSLRAKRALWLTVSYFALNTVVLFVGVAGICGPTLPSLLVVAWPVGSILLGFILWNGFKAFDDHSRDKVNFYAVATMAVAVVVFCFSALLASLGLLSL